MHTRGINLKEQSDNSILRVLIYTPSNIKFIRSEQKSQAGIESTSLEEALLEIKQSNLE